MLAFRLLVSLVGLAPLAAASQGPPFPNVVVIVADDLGYGDLGPYDHDDDPGTPPVTNTPVLDQMAAQGVRLTEFYVATPVCSPTRAALQTGRHNARIGITGVFGPNSTSGLSPSEITLAEMLRARGYATAIVGKWHLGHLPQFHPLQQGYDRFYGVPYSNDMSPFYVVRDTTVVDTNPDRDLLQAWFVEEAKDVIADAVAGNDPFFLYMPLVSPHVPVHVNPLYAGATGRGLYADALFEIDHGVGEILAQLAALGVDQNTLVVFTSDNGPWKNTHGPPPGHPEPWRWVGGSAGPLRGSKMTFFEGGLRVPFVARWPVQIPAGFERSGPAVCMDLFVTLATIAGAALPADRVMDGKNLLPLLAGTGSRDGDVLYFANVFSPSPELTAMRSGRWKLFFDNCFTPGSLYDLDLDVGETTPIDDPVLAAELWDQARQFQCTLQDPPVVVPSSINLALRRPSGASSSQGCDSSALAFDGDVATRWESDPGDLQWIEVDLGASTTVGQVVLAWGPSHAQYYQVQVSLDGSVFTVAASNSTGNGGRDVVPVGAHARYVRILAMSPSSGAGFSLREMQVHTVGLGAGGSHSGAHGLQ